MKAFSKPRAVAAPDFRAALLKMKSEAMANPGIKFDTIASMGRVNEEDQAQLSHDEFLKLKLNALDYHKLRQVDEALERLKDGEYGICLECAGQIAPRRLQAIPWASYCVHCQERIGNADRRDEDPASLFAHFTSH